MEILLGLLILFLLPLIIELGIIYLAATAAIIALIWVAGFPAVGWAIIAIGLAGFLLPDAPDQPAESYDPWESAA